MVVDDTDHVRKMLTSMLELDGFDVVGEAAGGAEAIEVVGRLDPDVVVIDYKMPMMDGLTAADLLYQELPECRTLILTGLGQPGNLLRALKAHVRGFIVKDAPAETLADGVRRVAAGERVIDPELVAAALETGTSPLTAREADVLRAAESGISTEAIATQLSLSPATVRVQVSKAREKLRKWLS